MYLLAFYVTEDHAESVKRAVFKAGGGQIGDYDECCWQTRGVGQFRPGESSQPFIGARGKLEQVEELKVELVVRDERLEACVEALIAAHPYEEPAYHAIHLAVPMGSSN